MRHQKSIFKLSFVILAIVVLACVYKGLKVKAQNIKKVEVEINTVNSWVENSKYVYQYDLKLTNQSDKDVEDWKVIIHLPGVKEISISNAWNIKAVVEADKIIVTPDSDYTKVIQSGGIIKDIGVIVYTDKEIKVGATNAIFEGKSVESVNTKPELPVAKPTEPPTEPPTVKPTEAPTEAPTETQTEPPTAKPTEPPTEAPTETPTEAPTEPPTEAETETKPNGYVEIKKNGNYFLYVGTPYYLAPGQWECSKDKNYCIADGEQIFYVRETGTYKLIMIK